MMESKLPLRLEALQSGDRDIAGKWVKQDSGKRVSGRWRAPGMANGRNDGVSAIAMLATLHQDGLTRIA